MSTVISKTSPEIDALLDETIVGGHVINNILYLTTKGGAEIVAGTIGSGSGGYDTINVKTDGGAIANGIADDTAAIHSARDLAGVGGIVFFPKGDYYITQLTASVANQTWILAPGANIYCHGTTHAINVTASGFAVEGSARRGKIDAGVGNAGSCVMVNNNLNTVTIRGVELVNGTYGVRCKGSSGPVTSRLLVTYTEIHNQSSHGVFFNWETQNSEISHNYIHDVSGNGVWCGETSINNRIIYNGIYNSGRIGIENHSGSNSAIIEGNVLDTCTSMGISIDSSDYCRVRGNKIVNVGSYGLECAAGNWCVYDANVVINTGSWGMSMSAISGTVNDNTIANNIFDHPTLGGITCGGSANGAKRTRVLGNEVIEPGNGAGGQSGITATGGIGVESWLVANNTVRYMTNPVSGSGINCGGPNHSYVSNFVIFDAGIVTGGGTGIVVSGSQLYAFVSGNQIMGNSKMNKGITVSSTSQYTVVSDNHILDTLQAIIDATGADNTNQIANNYGRAASGATYSLGSALGYHNRNAGSSYMFTSSAYRFDGNIGFFGKTPIAQRPSTAAAATDLTTTMALVNEIKADLVAYGLKA